MSPCMRTRTLAALFTVAGCGSTLAAQGTLADRVARAPDGIVQFSFPARAGICGDGRTFVSIDGSTFIGSFTSGDAARAACTTGPVRVVLERAGQGIVAVQTFVGPLVATPDVRTDLGTVSGPEAADYLLGLAATLDGRPGRDAVMPGALADGVDASARLLAIARNSARPVDTRRSALSWVAREADSPAAAARVGEALLAMARDGAETRAVRQRALSELGRLEGGAGIPAVVALTRAGEDAWLAREAVSAIARSGDPRARTALRGLVERPTMPDDAMAVAVRGLGGQYATAQDAALLRRSFVRLPGDRSRSGAINAVAEMGGAENVAWLLGIARDDAQRESVRRSALMGARRAGASAAQLAAVYDAGDNMLRGIVVNALAESGEPAAVDKLLAIARSGDDRTIRRRAVSALARLDDPRVRAALADIVER